MKLSKAVLTIVLLACASIERALGERVCGKTCKFVRNKHKLDCWCARANKCVREYLSGQVSKEEMQTSFGQKDALACEYTHAMEPMVTLVYDAANEGNARWRDVAGASEEDFMNAIKNAGQRGAELYRQRYNASKQPMLRAAMEKHYKEKLQTTDVSEELGGLTGAVARATQRLQEESTESHV